MVPDGKVEPASELGWWNVGGGRVSRGVRGCDQTSSFLEDGDASGNVPVSCEPSNAG